MRHPPFILLALVPLGLGLGGGAGLHHYFQTEQAKLARAQAAALRERRTEWAKAELAQRQHWAREIQDRQTYWQSNAIDQITRKHKDLESALGGPVQLAVKNPDLSLAEMIQGVALACSPPGSRAVVHVDRFTEFDLVIALSSLETRLVLADSARCILAPCAQYLNTLRFTYDTNILVEMDKRQIDSLTNWQTASRRQTLQVLEQAGEGRVASQAGGDSPENEPGVWDLESFNRTARPVAGSGKYAAATRDNPFADYDRRLLDKVNVVLEQLLRTDDARLPDRLGEIELKFNLHADGRVTDITVAKTDLDAIRSAVYARAVLDASPFPAWTDRMRRRAGGEVRQMKVSGARKLKLGRD